MQDYLHLISELQSFQTNHPEERDALPRFLSLLEKPNPADRHDYSPGHLTASAVVLSPANDLLLIHHPKLHRWLQPGGHIEPGEFDLRQSARRELLEETGLELPAESFTLFDLDIHEIPVVPGKHPAHLHYDLRYLAHSPTATLPETAQDACDARWFSRPQLSSLDLDPGIQRMIQKLGL